MAVPADGKRLWQLSTRTAAENGTIVLFLEGRLGHGTAAELNGALQAVLAAGRRDLVLDLSGVDYLSSAGLKVIESLALAQKTHGSKLSLQAPSSAARLSLQLSGLAGSPALEVT